MTMRYRTTSLLLVAVAALFVTSARPSGTWAAGNPNPKVLPRNSSAHGATYEEWVANWWSWAIAIPADQSPLLDETGKFGGVGQSGPVWFLAGAFGGTHE